MAVVELSSLGTMEKGLDPGLLDALTTVQKSHIKEEDPAKVAAALPIAQTLLATHGGLRSAIRKSTWDENQVHMSVVILSRMPAKDALARLVLVDFLNEYAWYNIACHCASNLSAHIENQPSKNMERIARGWLEFALTTRSEPSLCSPSRALPLKLLQAQMAMVRSKLCDEVELSRAINKRVGQLADAIETAEREARGQAPNGAPPPPPGAESGLPWRTTSGGSGASFLASEAAGAAGGSALKAAPILPRSDELLYGADPPANKTHGNYASCDEYVGTHFALLREDFVRPLRDAINGKPLIADTLALPCTHIRSPNTSCGSARTLSAHCTRQQLHVLRLCSLLYTLRWLHSSFCATPSTVQS